MPLTTAELLAEIAAASPAREAEVETKILLPLFILLGYRTEDRADKPPVPMTFGRKRETKFADFILYAGEDRSQENALMAVEAKEPEEALDGAEDQVRSYAAHAGTPMYLASNGKEILVSHYSPAGTAPPFLRIATADLPKSVDRLRQFAHRTEALLLKERLTFINDEGLRIEHLPPGVFLKEYLTQLRHRFGGYITAGQPLVAPAPHEDPRPPRIPVNVRITAEQGVAESLQVEDALLQGQCRIYVEGLPGSGKSTLCRRISAALAERILAFQANRIPIYISLAGGIPPTILAAFEATCASMGLRAYPTLYEAALHKWHPILILDGLDEIEPQSRIDELATWLSNVDWASILITSRPRVDSARLARLLRSEFTKTHIGQLAESEIHDVLGRHLSDPSLAPAIIDRWRNKTIPDISIAIFLLMVIRLVNEAPGWMKLSRYQLYQQYVGLLNNFFNAATVRGSTNISASDVDVNSCLSDAAVAVRNSRWYKRPLTFESLLHDLERRHSPSVVRSLVNTGLLISAGHALRFTHLTFEDYGVATVLLNRIERNAPEEFLQVPTQDSTFELVNSALSPALEQRLIDWLTLGRATVQRKAVQILQHGYSDLGADAIWATFIEKYDTAIGPPLLQALVGRGDSRVSTWLADHAAALPPKIVRRVAAVAPSGFLPLIRKLAEDGHFSAIAALWRAALRGIVTMSADDLLSILGTKSSTRTGVGSLLAQYRDVVLAQELAGRLLLSSTHMEGFVTLMGVAQHLSVAIDKSHAGHAVKLAGQGRRPMRPDVLRKLRKFVGRVDDGELQSAFAPAIEHLETLAKSRTA